ncbi:type I restriction enzyme, S subunit [Mycolicibacterium fluoranthenivorans]|uniref:Type I restriction enzyme, S subunit n=2 Tax=Mycolicibacterium fluoranthenivorans TaxID=258505 RepID=A0A1G4WKV2_9MYCO|nr:type I restriction enzyme, S subunit [Mycolicibacterium fluoranthenivorans]
MPTSMATSQDFWNWVCGPDLLPEYLNYQFKAIAPQLRAMNMGSTHQTIYQRDAASIEVLVPPVDEQRAIADYLDRETGRIDTLIDEQQLLVAMLRERHEATVSEALSGPEPVRLRRLVDPERPMTYGILQCGEPVPDGVPYIGPSDMPGRGQSPALNSLRRTTEEIAAVYKRSVLSGGDIVVSIGPAYGKVALIEADLDGANLTQDTVRVAALPNLVDSRYLVWVLLSREVSLYWDVEIMGATFRRLNLGTLARTPIPLPPIDEQRRIVAYLDEQAAKIDALIAETEVFIELSRERRSALITAAVTGQIDVCSEVA